MRFLLFESKCVPLLTVEIPIDCFPFRSFTACDNIKATEFFVNLYASRQNFCFAHHVHTIFGLMIYQLFKARFRKYFPARPLKVVFNSREPNIS